MNLLNAHCTSCSWCDSMDKDKILQEYYFNAKHPGAYSGPGKLLKVLRKKYPGVFTLNYVSKWLSKQDGYALPKTHSTSI